MGAQRTTMSVAVLVAVGCGSHALGQGCTPYLLRPDPFDTWSFSGFEGYGPIVAPDAHGPALFAHGFSPPNQPPANAVARWDRNHWTHLTQGLPPITWAAVYPLLVLDDGGGPHAYMVGVDAVTRENSVWWWDGSRWQPAPSGLYASGEPWPYAFPVCSFDDGAGPSIYGKIPGYVARWRGDRWESIGELQPVVSSLWLWTLNAGDGPALYAAGQFGGIVGVPNTRGIAKYQHGAWHAMGTGLVTGQILAMTVFDDGQGPALYVGGGIIQAGGVPVNGLARWRADHWEAVPGSPVGVRGMAVFDDGSGPSLFCTGDFSSVGGIPARHLVRFDGTHWWPVDPVGIPAVCRDIVAFDDGRGPSLFIVTGSGNLGGGWAPNVGISQYVGCPNCYADANNDGRLNVMDFIEFMRRYAARDAYANCSRDTTIDVSDFVCYMTRFAAGCR
jgi:hypothetical protein